MVANLLRKRLPKFIKFYKHFQEIYSDWKKSFNNPVKKKISGFYRILAVPFAEFHFYITFFGKQKCANHKGHQKPIHRTDELFCKTA